MLRAVSLAVLLAAPAFQGCVSVNTQGKPYVEVGNVTFGDKDPYARQQYIRRQPVTGRPSEELRVGGTAPSECWRNNRTSGCYSTMSECRAATEGMPGTTVCER